MTSTLIYDLSQSELAKIITSWGESTYRVKQIWQGLYLHLWNSPDQFTNLPVALRQKLADTFVYSNLEPETTLSSRDGETLKTLFRLPDRQPIETVLMCYARRLTLCISTQVGCAMGCVFCATGQMGFRRNLTSGEIVEQVLYYSRLLRQQDEEITNVVVMGMGEPFHNYEATLEAIDRLNARDGFNFGARRFTISTAGLVPGIRRFTAEKRQINLAVSLHTAEDELRSSLMPVNRKYNLDELLNACREYIEQTGRRISFEWALIQGINDTPEQARKLAERLQGLRRKGTILCHVNVILLNPSPHYTQQASTITRAEAFMTEIRRHGIPCSLRLHRGIDIQAGCGQLAGQR
jgi:23S rRNA (adenine2503-C2)-methyltransferase